MNGFCRVMDLTGNNRLNRGGIPRRPQGMGRGTALP